MAGTLDILAAFTSYYITTGKNPLNILNYVASGVFGKTDAYAGGAGMALLGLLFHYLAAFAFTIFFFFIYPKLKLQSVNRFILAILFGFFAWVVMNKLVVPLSNTPKPATPQPFNWFKNGKEMLILIVMIGLPLSLIFGKYYQEKEPDFFNT
jgi:uncharacterized membrane protein YagU involved in acid resistance